jgi:hypothetical protein
MTRACRVNPTAKSVIGLKHQPDSISQHINPVSNFSLTKNQFYSPIMNFCEAFHGSEFADPEIIHFLPEFHPTSDFVTH